MIKAFFVFNIFEFSIFLSKKRRKSFVSDEKKKKIQCCKWEKRRKVNAVKAKIMSLIFYILPKKVRIRDFFSVKSRT